MLNTYQNQQTIKINTVSGGIVKNYKDSFFERFHLKSDLASKILGHKPEYPINQYVSKPIVVIQMMVCGDMEVVAELMFKDDFEKLFGGDSDENKP